MLSGWVLGVAGRKYGLDHAPAVLSGLGAEGWELAGTAELPGGVDKVQMIFKQPLAG